MNTNDAKINIKQINIVSGVTSDFISIASKKSVKMAAVTSISSDDTGTVTIDNKSLKIVDDPSLTVGYEYNQVSAPENLIFKVEFSSEFPADAKFEIKSNEFPGFHVNKQTIANKELNSSTQKPFNTDLELSVWFGNEQAAKTASIKLKFYKIESGTGGFDKQIKIADTTLTLNSNI